MRSTLVLDDELVKRAKIKAARENTTLSELVNRGLFLILHQAQCAEDHQPYSAITHGDGAADHDYDPAELAELDGTDDLTGYDR